MNRELLHGIAIISMTGRFPKAPDLDHFWSNLRSGVEAVSFFSDAELETAGVAPILLRDPNYVKAKAVLDDIGLFDASFFGFSPREAELTDPQIRIFLECAWQALETAGYNPDSFPGLIGVYAGMSFSTYMLHLIGGNTIQHPANAFRALLGSDRDYLSTWVSYKLNLHGPSFNVQTACSTSLAAVHLACRSLTTFECDMALAGGVSVSVPQRMGYMYDQGGILSSDGHCRAFDAKSDGSIAGEGIGVVLLKRLEDAMESRDTICAVIKGSAVNNDGRRKVGYTAPAVEGQAEVIAMALAVAEVEHQSVGYIEAHGSGTAVGDPVEIAGLNRAYAKSAVERGSIPIGSVKTNVGHLGPAAGIAGLIKTVLAIRNGQIPPSLHFQVPNPEIPFDRGPFFVNSRLSLWPPSNKPRRAGVSSFGVGGTNVHVILEEAPEVRPSDSAKPWQIVVISAKSVMALESATDQLVEHLRRNPHQNFADVAFTLQVGRKAFEYRRIAVCNDAVAAVKLLQARTPSQVLSSAAPSNRRPLAFLFPGLGDHYVDMGRGLYEAELEFARQVDLCSEFLQPYLGRDLRELMYPDQSVRRQCPVTPQDRFDLRKIVIRAPENAVSAAQGLRQTLWAQPALFVTEYALAKLWMSWGIVPDVMLGYSIGEYVAACLANVISLQDSLRLLAERAQRIEELPQGAMLAIAAPAANIRSWLAPEICVTGINGPSLCIVAGPPEAIQALEQHLLEGRDIACRRLWTAHAFHSPMMEPVAAALTKIALSMRVNAPQIPYISNVTGTWITAAETSDPAYWGRHLCEPVRFEDGLRQMCLTSIPVLLEVGPGQMLSSVAEQYLAGRGVIDRVILPSLPHSSDQQPDNAFVLQALGQLWLAGIEPDWGAVHAHSRRNRVPLPTYPFDRRHYWLGGRPSADKQQVEPSGMLRVPVSTKSEEFAAQTAIPGDATIALGVNTTYSRPNLGTSYVPPTNTVEQKIVDIWEGLMGIHPIGIHDNFLRLGGNSLVAIRVAAELREAFQIALPVQALLTTSSVAELALVVENAVLTMIEGTGDTEVS